MHCTDARNASRERKSKKADEDGSEEIMEARRVSQVASKQKVAKGKKGLHRVSSAPPKREVRTRRGDTVQQEMLLSGVDIMRHVTKSPAI